ncbi:hypothetical protein D3C76_1253010 [compost metagenome]
MLLELRVIGQELQHLLQRNDADHRNTEIALHFLDRRQFAIATFLTVQGDQHPGGLGLLAFDDLHDFADGGAGGNHVVYDQDVTGKRRAHQAAAFAMGLGFLAVETPRHIELMMLGQRYCCGRRQGNALVGRAEEYVKGNSAFDDGCRVESAQLRQGGTCVEQAGIEEIRACTPRFQGKFTEAQNPTIDGKTNEVALIRLHGKVPNTTDLAN